MGKLDRTCLICGTSFLVKKACRTGKACSKLCRSKLFSKIASDRKASQATKDKMSASQKRLNSDPVYRDRRSAAARDGLRSWLSDEDNAKKFSKASSDRMRMRHADPEWQKIRNARSSETLKKTWQAYRETFIENAKVRYAEGLGLNSLNSIVNKKHACEWIMQKCQDELHQETNCDEVFAEAQERARRDFPYDGKSDYMEYMSKIGKMTVSDPEYRELVDNFMKIAIPKFSKEWNKKKKLANATP